MLFGDNGGHEVVEEMIGKTISHYKILEKLGEGGMGVVYKAMDTKLERTVALKFLSHQMLDSEQDKARFLREAKAAAVLDHPNICTLYETYEVEGETFIAMAFCEGQTLEEKIKDGPLDIDEAVDIAIQVGEGLKQAHKQGIIHRDIKSANIMFDETGRARIMDFGLAKLTGKTKITETATVMGTVAYMSPEQASGEPVDHRTDIWSLGVVLYEMLTGITPFAAKAVPALIYKIAYEKPVDARNLNPGIPTGLSVVLGRAIAKNKENRYASISEFLTDICAHKTLGVEKNRYTRSSVFGLLETEVMPLIAERTPFVGRKSEWGDLHRFLSKAAFGQGALVMIGGEPGVGKTRLIEELVAEARRYGFLCLTGHCYEMEGTPPYIPFVEIIESAARIVEPSVFFDTLGDSASEVAKLMPELRRIFPNIPSPAKLPPEQERRYMFNAVVEFIARAAKTQPLLFAFEDLHWADESTMLLLQHIAHRINDMRALFIGTYRDTELTVSLSLARVIQDLFRQRLVHDIFLRRLPEADVAAMIRERSGQDPPASLVRLIFNETGGNPFFVEETFRHLAEEKKLFDSEGQWRTDLRIDEADVPRSVRLVLGYRIDRLDEQCRNTLTAAAATGRAVSFELLKELMNLDEDTLLDSIEEAERAQLIRSTTKAGDIHLTFPHEMIPHTLLNDISRFRRQRLHFRVAEAMEKIYASTLDDYAAELAYHLFQAGAAADIPKAIHYLTLAGDRAFEAAAFEDALRLHNDALSLKPHDDVRPRAQLMFKRGLALRSLGRLEETLADWQEALTIYERLDDIEAVGKICAELSTYQLSITEFVAAYETVERGLAALGNRRNATRCRLLATKGFLLANVQQVGYSVAHDLFKQALDIVEELKDERPLGDIMGRKAFLHHTYWQGQEAADVGLRGWKLAESRDPYGASYPLTYGHQCGMLWIGELKEAEKIRDQAKSLATRSGNSHAHWFADHYDSFREVAVTGDLVQFEKRRKALLETELALASGWITLSYAYLGRAQFWRGRWEEALESYRKGSEKDVQGHMAGLSGSLLLLLAAYSRNKQAALAVLQENKEILPQAGKPNMYGSWSMLMAAIEGLAMLEEWDEAAGFYPLALEAIGSGNKIRAAYDGLVQTTVGIAAAADGQWEKAEEHYLTALKQAHEIPYRIEQPEVRRWYGHMLTERNASGDKEKANILLTEAIAMYREIGMPKHLEIAEGLMGKL